jgi:hypothetical protein
VVAAFLKLYQVSLPTPGPRELFASPAMAFAAAAIEGMLGVLLLAGVFAVAVRRVAIVAFSAFAAISAYRGLNGYSSCGCFGPWQVHPWYTFAFDLAAVAALLLAPAPLARPAASPARLAVTICLALLPAIAGGALISFSPRTTEPEPGFNVAGRYVILQPERWPGRRFALAGHTDIGGELSVGRWRVLLFHHQCPQCQRVLAAYEAMGRDLAAAGSAERIALIELPPFADVETLTTPTHVLRGKLDGSRKWFVPTPTVIGVVDGKVVDVRAGEVVANEN